MCVCQLIEQSYDRSFNGFSHRDIAVHWTSSYMHLGYKNSTPKKIQKAFDSLATNVIKGPTLRTPISDSIKILPRLPLLAPSQSIKNYNSNDVPSKFEEPFDGLETTFIKPNSCSQSLESLFSDAINDSEFPQTLTVDARSALKGTVDDCY